MKTNQSQEMEFEIVTTTDQNVINAGRIWRAQYTALTDKRRKADLIAYKAKKATRQASTILR